MTVAKTVRDAPLRLPPTEGRARRLVPVGGAFAAMLAFAAWGLGTDGRSGWLALALAAGVAGVVAVAVAAADRSARADAAAFLAGLQDGGLRVREPRCLGDAFGGVRTVTFRTPLGGASFRLGGSLTWHAPGRPNAVDLRWPRPNDGFTGDTRARLRSLGRQQAEALAARPGPSPRGPR